MTRLAETLIFTIGVGVPATILIVGLAMWSPYVGAAANLVLLTAAYALYSPLQRP